MVQFIPSAPGTTPYRPYRPSPLEQLGQGTGSVGLALGAPDANGNSGGLAAVMRALSARQTLSKFLNVPDQPSATPGGAPTNPLGPLSNTPVNRIQQMSDLMGKTGVAGILGNANTTTLYMDPATGQMSMVPSPGAIPIGGYKGPKAAEAVGRSKHESLLNDHMALMDKLRAKNSDESLSTADKRIIALARINTTALSNPLADFSEEDMATMRDTIKQANAILSKSAGVSAGAPAGTKASPDGSGKGGKDPKAWLQKNYPGYPLTPKNIKWAQDQMNGK